MTIVRAILVAVLLAAPVQAMAAETYDLIFRQGTLDGLPTAQVLTYEKQVQMAANPDYATRHSGAIELNFEPDDMARLRFKQDGKFQNLGMFPATVGNPIIMYFVETVLRDVAHEAGGSPFYIRNRIKEALLTQVPVTDAVANYDGASVTTKEITLHPFVQDKNRNKMGLYADLSLTFVMSDAVPGWYSSLSATAPGADGKPGYANSLTLLPGPGQ